MHKLFSLIAIFLISICYAQTNTDVFLFDLNSENGAFELSNVRNISNNEGYDNQPSFMDNNTILFAGTRNGQTDIVKYNINSDFKIFINQTDGGEYSPLKIPSFKAVSAIRLDKDGKQFLYKYNINNGTSEVLVDDIIIGYHVWYNNKTIISSVLEDSGLSLYSTNIKKGKNTKHDSKIGRSLHNIPNSNLVSYISKQSDTWEIKSIHPKTGNSKLIAATLPKKEDMCWLTDGKILMGKDDKLYTYQPYKSKTWTEVASLSNYNITNISRMIVSPDGTKLAVVGEVVEKLEHTLSNISWLSGNWKGEAMGGLVEENWSEPSGGSMMATFKFIENGKTVFYEIEIIREVNNTLILQLKHFNNDLTGWETKDETEDFPVQEITANKITFEGMTFEKVNDSEMIISVDMHKDDGSVEILKFNYTKQ